MKIFISWSGGVSHDVAQALNEWLPDVLQEVKPFLSSEHIQKGGLWFHEIGSQLEETNFGILCLTPANQEAPWILFEAGALSKQVGKSHVVPLLIGLAPSDLKPPLSNFNAASLNREEMEKLVKTINAQIGEKQLPEPQLRKAFDKWWPDLNGKLQQATSRPADTGSEEPRVPERDLRDMVAELIELTRGVAWLQAEEALYETFDDLPVEWRTAFALKETEKLTYEDIASIMNRPIRTVEKAVRLARLLKHSAKKQ